MQSVILDVEVEIRLDSKKKEFHFCMAQNLDQLYV